MFPFSGTAGARDIGRITQLSSFCICSVKTDGAQEVEWIFLPSYSPSPQPESF